MNGYYDQKVTARHRARDAYLYIRHAIPRKGFANVRRIQRQYELRREAVELGWPKERVIVIDSDVGQSGASETGRRGFQMLARQIELGCVGLVIALEPSRLTRSVGDWHRLLEACTLSDTLLLDQNGLYDPADSKDRALLGCGATTPETTKFSQSK